MNNMIRAAAGLHNYVNADADSVFIKYVSVCFNSDRVTNSDRFIFNCPGAAVCKVYETVINTKFYYL